AGRPRGVVRGGERLADGAGRGADHRVEARGAALAGVGPRSRAARSAPGARAGARRTRDEGACVSAGESFPRLVAIMRQLLGPGGCPWDREQTKETLRPFVIEEAFEVVDAIDRGSASDLREELGDLLMQVVFLAE